MRIVDSSETGFKDVLDNICSRGNEDTSAVEAVVKAILDDVRARGDRAVKEYTLRFDGVSIKRGGLVSRRARKEALRAIHPKDVDIMKRAAARIEDYHARQRLEPLIYEDDLGNTLGAKVTPLDRVALYVPGGKASYPSTVLMNAIPARVAGVGEIIMTTPPGKDGINPYVLAAAEVVGVDSVYAIGGAQAIGAAAYGTESVPRVDKITGPGNIYVATAKRLVYGTVDIDMIAGPSEILIINDGTGDPAWLAADLLSQAEHDELASSILLTTSRKKALAVQKEVRAQLSKLRPALRRKVAEKSVSSYGLIVVVGNMEEALEISNKIAPEHLELFVSDPMKALEGVRNAGAVFLGSLTPESTGDYMAGPNHTLPTGGTARFSSPLGIYDFQKRTSVIGFSPRGLKALGRGIQRFATIEGLTAHATSVKKRL